MADELALQKKDAWQRTRDYFADVRAEMRRVTWPGKQEIYGTTVMVIITTFAFAFYFYLCDTAFSRAASRLLSWLAHGV